MPTRDEVVEQLKRARNVGGLGLMAKLGGLTGQLPQILRDGEPIENWVAGQDLGPAGDQTNAAILIATPDRLLYASAGAITGGGLDHVEFAYGQITEVRDKTGLLTGSIQVIGADRSVRLDRVSKGDVKSFAEDLRRRAAQAR